MRLRNFNKGKTGREMVLTRPAEKETEIMKVEELNMSQQCVLDIQKFKRVLVCTNRSMANKSTLVRPHLECGILFGVFG